MAELTEQEKLERRRQKRQQRILQSGESRLGKITGTAFPNRNTPSPSPSPSTSSMNTPSASIKTPQPTFRTQRRDSDDPSEELGAPEPIFHHQQQQQQDMSQDMNAMMNQTFASMFGGVAGIPGSEGSFNPAALLGAMGGAGGGNNEAFQNLLSSNGNEGAFDPTAMFGAQQMAVDTSTRYWGLLHLVSMIMLGVYAVYFEWTKAGADRFAHLLYSNVGVANYPAVHVPLFWYFVTLELCMQSARLFYQKGTMPPTSTIASMATQLPYPFGNIVTIFLRYRLIWSCLVQDICVLVFIIGLSQVFSNLI
ncbi:hypothetical protein INT47_002481 [Mucor saturninus]|uniref:Uncharacterized protein n=1 Tax=Mucor saturninus TaxID=64648 RepID=A0A8H7RFM2_9FUNG|nr:hypothetical protein INT47_002481 [Mucor saturninus]